MNDPRAVTQQKARVKHHFNGGWYVVRGHGQFSEYLHSDGIWRKKTVRHDGGKTVVSGHFPSKQAAREALTAAEPAKSEKAVSSVSA